MSIEVKSKFLEPMQRAAAFFKLMGSKILIERIDQGEAKTRGGLIIAEAPNMRQDLKLQKPHLGVVVAVGEGYFDEESRSYVPLDVKPGNIVMVNGLGVAYYSVLPGVTDYTGNSVGLTTEADVQLIFANKEAFDEYTKAIGVPLT